MRLARRRPGSAVIAVLLGLVIPGCGQSDPAIMTVSVYDLLAALPRATRQSQQPEYVAVRTAVLASEQKRVLFLHPASSLEFPAVTLGQDAVFTAALALEEVVQEKPGDGVEFNVSVRLPDGTVVKVFSRYVDPRVNEKDRGWLMTRVPLGGFAGQKVSIILSTTVGPKGDSQFDWALWGEPRVILGPL